MQYNLTDVQTDGRDPVISFLRCISMAAIILCHFFQYYNNELAWWFNVGVQVFFVISGYLYGNKRISDPASFVAKQFKKILIPYYIVICLFAIVDLILFPSKFSIRGFAKMLICADMMPGSEHLWFVGYILFCYLITPFLFWITESLKKYSLRRSLVFYALLLGLVQIIGFGYNSYFRPFYVSCYIIGYICAIYRKDRGLEFFKPLLAVASIACIILNGTQIIMKYVLRVAETGIGDTLLAICNVYGHLALGVTIFLLSCLLLNRGGVLEALGRSRWLRITDRHSYHVYLVHQFFILGQFSLLRLTNSSVVNYCLVGICIVVSTAILSILSAKVLKIVDRISARVFRVCQN